MVVYTLDGACYVRGVGPGILSGNSMGTSVEAPLLVW